MISIIGSTTAVHSRQYATETNMHTREYSQGNERTNGTNTTKLCKYIFDQLQHERLTARMTN